MGPHGTWQEPPGPGRVAGALRTGGPFNFSITWFPLVSRVLAAGLPLHGRHGRG